MPKLTTKNNPTFVLDTFALLAVLYEENDFAEVVSYLDHATQKKSRLLFNEINLGELYYRVWKDQGKEAAEKAYLHVSQLPLEFITVNRAFILAASTWKAQYRISYADAFVVETAQRNNCAILTGDPEFDTIPMLKIIRLGKKYTPLTQVCNCQI